MVGLDPFPDRVADPESFCKEIVDAVAPYAVAVKPQSAFFEARGWEGVRAFQSVCRYAREAGLLVIAEVKRGDIGTTAQAYLDAVRPHADAAIAFSSAQARKPPSICSTRSAPSSPRSSSATGSRSRSSSTRASKAPG